jgi:hypothetical protein
MGAAAFAVAALIVIWIAGTDGQQLREHLKRAQFWSLEATVALGLLACAALWPQARLRERRLVLPLAALVAFALTLTLFVAPRTNRIFYDEQIYQNIGQNLSDLKLAQMCNDGVVEYGRLQCWSGEYNKQPYAYPHLLSVLYRLFGVRQAVAFNLNAVVMALTVVVVFITALALFGDATAAFFAALVVTVVPQQLLWSATAAVEPSASLACASALGLAALFVRRRDTASLVATGVATVYASQFRTESVLIVPIVGFLLWSQTNETWRSPRVWWTAVGCLALFAVPFAHLVAVRNEGWGTTDARLSLQYVADNLRVNGTFFLGDARFPVVLTVLALTGLAAGRALLSVRVTLLLYFLAFFGIQLLFYAGSYNYGADVRYSLMTYPPIALLAGLGAARVARSLRHYVPERRGRQVVTAALLFQFLWYLPAVRATTEEAWAARADVRFAESFAADVGGNAYVLTHNPGMFHVWGINAGQMSLALHNPTYIDYLATRYAGGVFLHWNFWCNVAVPEQQALCRMVRDQRAVVLVREHRERDQRFALYRFVTGTAPEQ